MSPRLTGANGHRTAKLLESVCEGAGQPSGVRVSVVHGGHVAQPQVLIGELGYGSGLVEVIVGDAVVAGVVV